MSRLSALLTLLTKEIAKLESSSNQVVINREFIRAQLSRDNARHVDEVFISAYSHYIISTRMLDNLIRKYVKGERSIKETASMIDSMSKENNGSTVFSNNKGLWHPSGYYGLYMSKNRLDFDNRFRKSAKPPPPTRFENRLTIHSSQHPFSAHENRHYFQNDGSYFGKDTLIGKRKVNGRSYSAQPGLLNWKNADTNHKFYQGSQHLPHFQARDPLCIHKDNEIFPLSKFSLKSAYQDAFGSDTHNVYKAPHEFDVEPTMKSTYKKAFNGSRNNLPWTSRYSTH